MVAFFSNAVCNLTPCRVAKGVRQIDNSIDLKKYADTMQVQREKY